MQKLTQLNAEVTRAKTERLQQEAMYIKLQQRQADHSSLETFAPILTNPYIQQQKTVLSELLRQQTKLAETYGDKNDQMIAIKSLVEGAQTKLDSEMQKVVQSLTTDYQVAVAREKSLVQALDDQKAEDLLMNSKAIEYNVLQREVESSKQIYDSLMQRAKETGVSAALTTSNIRIIDVAEKPRVPVSPNRLVNLLAGLLGGAVLAIGLVFFVEYMDNRLRTPDDITYHLRLPHLGFVPLLPKSQEASGYALTSRSTPATFVDAFRVIRTNMLVCFRRHWQPVGADHERRVGRGEEPRGSEPRRFPGASRKARAARRRGHAQTDDPSVVRPASGAWSLRSSCRQRTDERSRSRVVSRRTLGAVFRRGAAEPRRVARLSTIHEPSSVVARALRLGGD